MIPNRIKISQHATARLRFLKSQTGLTPNILSRIAFMLAIRDMRKVPHIAEDLSGQEFNSPTLFGEHQEVYELLLTKYFHKVRSVEDSTMLIANLIEKGLHKMGHLRSLEEIVSLSITGDKTMYLGSEIAILIAELREACRFFEVTQGRAIRYLKLLQSFQNGESNSEEQQLAYFESQNLISLHRLWRTHARKCPKLKSRLRSIFEDGSTLSKHELDKGKEYRSYSDAFVFLLAGRLLMGGIQLSHVEEFQFESDGYFVKQAATKSQSDIGFVWNDRSLVVECKRVRSSNQIEKRVREAIKQIKAKQRYGVIAIDYPPLLQAEGPIVERHECETNDGRVLNLLESELWIKKISSVALRSKWVIGTIICINYPARTHRTGKYPRHDRNWSVVVVARQGISWSKKLMLDVKFALESTAHERNRNQQVPSRALN